MKVTFENSHRTTIDTCCFAIGNAIHNGFIDLTCKQVVIYNAEEINDGAWMASSLPISHCPFCGANIEITVSPDYKNLIHHYDTDNDELEAFKKIDANAFWRNN